MGGSSAISAPRPREKAPDERADRLPHRRLVRARYGGLVLRRRSALADLCGVLGVVFVGLQGEVWRVPWHAAVLRRPAFYVFAVPLLLSLLLPLVRFVQLIGGDVDPAERIRLTALLVASPFWLAGISSPPKWKPL